MAATLDNRWRGKLDVLKGLLALATCALVVASCASSSNDLAAMEASRSGDQKAAISLALKEVARFSTPDQCSRGNNLNCGTLALAYGSLAEYQILDGDLTAGESSFDRAKGALELTANANKASATGIVYLNVSEAYWKLGDRARAIAVFDEGRAAGGDSWLMSASAAGARGRGRQKAPQNMGRGEGS
jgi:hypothetical protein